MTTPGKIVFLMPDELVTLTGLRRPSAQVRWLRSRRIRHYVNAVGHPVVARAWIVDDERQAAPKTAKPDLRVINGGA